MEGVNIRLVLAVVSSACWSAFQHGYNTGVLNAPQKVMKMWISYDAMALNGSLGAGGAEGAAGEAAAAEEEEASVTAVWAVVVAVYCVGGMIGGVLTGNIADRFGRKGGLLLNNVLVFAGVACEASAKAANSYELLIFGRLLIGINSGLNAGLAPMYLAEISPVNLRGSIGTVYQLVITMTILLSQAVGLETALGTESGWPWLLALPALPAALQCAMLPLCPESPKYLLLNRGREPEAHRALSWLRGNGGVHGEMEEMHQEAEKNKVSKLVTLRELVRNRSLRAPLLVAGVVMVAQQLSGINAVMFYSTQIFEQANLKGASAQYATIGMGAMNVVMTVVSLVLVEQAGRKTLLLVGFLGMFVVTACLTVAMQLVYVAWVTYACIALVILFVVMFATGPGSIPWFLVTELFNQSARPAAASVAVTVNWTANFIVGISFPVLENMIHGYVFAIFAVLQVLFATFIWFKVPETKNKTVEEITAMFRQNL